MKTKFYMDINLKIEELLKENEIAQETLDAMKEKIKSNNRTIGKLRTALTHVENILGEDENVFAITADGPTKEL